MKDKNKELKKNNSTRKRLERKYMIYRNREIYTPLEDINFHWNKEDIEKFRVLWNNGIGFDDISRYLKRDPIELAVLLLDLAKQKKLKMSLKETIDFIQERYQVYKGEG